MRLQEDDNHLKKEPNRELDRFSRFMFGVRKQREENKKDEDISQDTPEQKEASSIHRKTNQFDNWFFGSRRQEVESSAPTRQNQLEQQVENILNQVDIGLLMETIDMLVETTKQYKPILKKITPMFNQFKKKFKSK
ncbi:hypothetical protein [Neobacillus cucumis]|uniref:hypothetical protein n=1 Tax=Neobacillus cucumis TaxID=1740721 RepID=UPI002E227DB8|nr:hypothetical protein [Neobacillus cucumis]